MRAFIAVCSLVLAGTAGFDAGAPPRLTGGGGVIYVGTYSGRILVIDEAAEKVVGEIVLKTGFPRRTEMSRDGTRIYALSGDLEQVEVVDVAQRRSTDTFTLSEATKKTRVVSFTADPLHRFMVMATITSTKLPDRFEVGPAMLTTYDLKEHKAIKSIPWPIEDDPGYFGTAMRISPDGKLLYFFGDEVSIVDTTTFQKVGSWPLSKPNEPGFGAIAMGSVDDINDEPGYFTGLFTTDDPVQNRRLLGIGRVNLSDKKLDYYALGPAPARGVSTQFALAPDRKRGSILTQDIRHFELWTVDLDARRVQSKVEFDGRSRMALRPSSNGKILYIHQAGNTIDLYDEAGFKYLRTMTVDADMVTGSFHVVRPR
jgi:hypothetical protein